MVRMRMVPVSARRSGTNCEDVVVCLAGRDRLEWTAIGLDRQMDPVPVNRRRFCEIVLEVNDDVIPLAHVERWAGDVSVVGEHLARDTRLQRKRRHSGGEIHLDGLRKFGDIDEDGRVRCIAFARNDHVRRGRGCAERLVWTRDRDERPRQSQQSEERKSVGHASSPGLCARQYWQRRMFQQ